MPLKHQTETILLILLGLAIVLTGVAIGTLPDLPLGTALWGIAWALSIAYPLLIYPILKDRRADYSFRMLHFFPAMMLFAWLILQIGAFYIDFLSTVIRWYTWGWTFGITAVGFFALILFSIHVIRQKGSRMLFLLAVFVPFAVIGAGGEVTGVRTELLAVLDGGGRLMNMLKIRNIEEKKEQTTKPTVMKKNDKNLFASSDEEEETWRMRLRRMERREDRLSSQSSAMISREPPMILPSSSDDVVNPVVIPPNLVSSGPIGMDMVGLIMLAGTCASVHWKVRKRTLERVEWAV